MPAEPNPAPTCSLAGTDFAARVEQWQTLATMSLVAREATPLGVRLAFRPEGQVVHHLADLLDAERRCCSWAAWTLTSTAEAAIVEATTAPSQVQALHHLFGVTT